MFVLSKFDYLRILLLSSVEIELNLSKFNYMSMVLLDLNLMYFSKFFDIREFTRL